MSRNGCNVRCRGLDPSPGRPTPKRRASPLVASPAPRVSPGSRGFYFPIPAACGIRPHDRDRRSLRPRRDRRGTRRRRDGAGRRRSGPAVARALVPWTGGAGARLPSSLWREQPPASLERPRGAHGPRRRSAGRLLRLAASRTPRSRRRARPVRVATLVRRVPRGSRAGVRSHGLLRRRAWATEE